jgi:hypothetical protein
MGPVGLDFTGVGGDHPRRLVGVGGCLSPKADLHAPSSLRGLPYSVGFGGQRLGATRTCLPALVRSMQTLPCQTGPPA